MIKHANSRTHPKTMATSQDAKADNFRNQKKMNMVLIFQSENWEPETMTLKIHITVQGPKPFMVVSPRV